MFESIVSVLKRLSPNSKSKEGEVVELDVNDVDVDDDGGEEDDSASGDGPDGEEDDSEGRGESEHDIHQSMMMEGNQNGNSLLAVRLNGSEWRNALEKSKNKPKKLTKTKESRVLDESINHDHTPKLKYNWERNMEIALISIVQNLKAYLPSNKKNGLKLEKWILVKTAMMEHNNEKVRNVGNSVIFCFELMLMCSNI